MSLTTEALLVTRLHFFHFPAVLDLYALLLISLKGSYWDSSEEDTEEEETVESEGVKEEEKEEAESESEEREVGLKSRRNSGQLGVVGRKNWEAKKKRKVERGVGRQVYVGVLLRGSRSLRRGGRRHSNSMILSWNK